MGGAGLPWEYSYMGDAYISVFSGLLFFFFSCNAGNEGEFVLRKGGWGESKCMDKSISLFKDGGKTKRDDFFHQTSEFEL